MKASDQYLKIVDWSEEDRCYVGTCPGLMLGGIHGKDEVTVYRELCRTVEEWIAVQKEDHEPLPPATAGKEYSGKFVLRIGKELHEELAVSALRERESLNSYCLKSIKEGHARYVKAKSPRPLTETPQKAKREEA